MGMYDSVLFTCECGATIEAQSKGGSCIFQEYNQNEVPIAVAVDCDQEIIKCNNCNVEYRTEAGLLGYVRMFIVRI